MAISNDRILKETNNMLFFLKQYRACNLTRGDIEDIHGKIMKYQMLLSQKCNDTGKAKIGNPKACFLGVDVYLDHVLNMDPFLDLKYRVVIEIDFPNGDTSRYTKFEMSKPISTDDIINAVSAKKNGVARIYLSPDQFSHFANENQLVVQAW